MKIILNKQDIQNLHLWAETAKIKAKELRVPFEEDEEKTLKKIRTAFKLSFGYEPSREQKEKAQ